MQWQIAPEDAVRLVPLDMLTAAFHRRSAQTHLLAEPMPEIVAALEAGPADAGALLARLKLDDDEETHAALTARINELIAIGIVSTAH